MRHVPLAVVALVVLVTTPAELAPQTPAPGVASSDSVSIPFELTGGLIIVPVSVSGSRPLSFVLDTGIDAPIVNLARAKELRLQLFGKITLSGAGPGATPGSWVRGATLTMPGLDGFVQPASLALDLTWVQAALGRDIGGLLGGRFIRGFVVEVDYHGHRIVLHDRAAFRYQGPGETLPFQFTARNQPLVTATITPIGGTPVEGTLMVDLGSSLAMALNNAFVERHALPGPDVRTIRAVGVSGFGGVATGRFGRVAELRLGSLAIVEPIVLFSEDTASTDTVPDDDGVIGAQIANRFRVFLDYGSGQMILEPAPAFARPFDRAESGLAIRAFGDDYRTFQILGRLEGSPATDAGIEVGDVIVAVDGRQAATLTLSALNDLFERVGTYVLTIRRGDRTLQVALTTRRMV